MHINTHSGPVNKTNTHHTLLEDTPAESILGSIIGSVSVLMKPSLAEKMGEKQENDGKVGIKSR